MLTRFGEGVSISYVMPVDPRLWLEHPPVSTYLPTWLRIPLTAVRLWDPDSGAGRLERTLGRLQAP